MKDNNNVPETGNEGADKNNEGGRERAQRARKPRVARELQSDEGRKYRTKPDTPKEKPARAPRHSQGGDGNTERRPRNSAEKGNRRPPRDSRTEGDKQAKRAYVRNTDDSAVEKPFAQKRTTRERDIDGDRPARGGNKRNFEDRGKERPFNRPSGEREEGSAEKRPYKRAEGEGRSKREGDRSYKSSEGKGRTRDEGDRPYKRSKGEGNSRSEGDRAYKRSAGEGRTRSEGERPYKRTGDGTKRSANKRERDEKPYENGNKKAYERRKSEQQESAPRNESYNEDAGEEVKKGKGARQTGSPKDFGARRAESTRKFQDIDNEQNDNDNSYQRERRPKPVKQARIPVYDTDKLMPKKRSTKKEEPADETQMPVNKYIAHSGLCSRRDAAVMVKEGKVTVNGQTVTDPGFKVQASDEVRVNDKKMTLQKGHVYLLLNKPKDYITTNDDPQGRKTIMDLLEGAKDAGRIFPVGRLDRNTTGLLVLTNDGDLAQKLAHPSNRIKKIYKVTLDKNLTKAHFEQIMAGLELEDGIAEVDEMAWLETKNELGLEIHSGKNRIVRRIFEHLGYVVEKLDRMMYAGLTKKNLPRGKWRALTEKEVVILKHLKGG